MIYIIGLLSVGLYSLESAVCRAGDHSVVPWVLDGSESRIQSSGKELVEGEPATGSVGFAIYHGILSRCFE